MVYNINSVPLLVLNCLLVLSLEKCSAGEQRSDLAGIWSEIVMRSSSTLDKECPSCMKFVTNIASDGALKLTRVESIKQAILDGLGMSEPPKINISSLLLPKPIRNGDIIKKENHDDGQNEDSQSRNPSKVMILSSGTLCKKLDNGFEVLFKIEIPWNVNSAELTEATLWLYTETESNLKYCKFYSKPCGSQLNYNQIFIENADFKDGWTQLDFTSPFTNWLEYEEFCQEIKLVNDEEINEIYNSVYANESANKPFAIVNMSPYKPVNRNRNKRNLNCLPTSTECCREKLSISFSQINWDNWIVHPPSYDAYYCKGRCDDVATIALGNTPYFSVLHKLRLNSQIKDKLPGLRGCCVPKQLTTLQIIYVNQNGTYMETKIPNMAVTSCGCT